MTSVRANRATPGRFTNAAHATSERALPLRMTTGETVAAQAGADTLGTLAMAPELARYLQITRNLTDERRPYEEWSLVPYLISRLITHLGVRTVKAGVTYQQLCQRWREGDPAHAELSDAEWRDWCVARDAAFQQAADRYGLKDERALKACAVRCRWFAVHGFWRADLPPDPQ